MGVFDHDMRSNVVYCSPEVHQIYGWPPDLVARLEMFGEHAHPDDRRSATRPSRAPTTRRATAATTTSTASSAPTASSAGCTRARRRSSRGPAHARKAARVIGAITDITDARAALALLRDREDRLRRAETAQKKAEAGLLANQERLAQAVRLGRLGIFDHDHATGAGVLVARTAGDLWNRPGRRRRVGNPLPATSTRRIARARRPPWCARTTRRATAASTSSTA